MSQANPFMITAVGGLHSFDKDKELSADELAVLRQKLGAFKEALESYLDNTAWSRFLLFKLGEFDLDLEKMNRSKKRIEVVTFVREHAFKNKALYGEEVAQKAEEFLRYWKEHALPGAQV